MKLEIYDEKKSRDAVVRLQLQTASTGVDLAAVDETGLVIPGGFILRIQDNGTLRRHASCAVPGLQVSDAEQIALEDV